MSNLYDVIKTMLHGRIGNYIVPGLNSSLIGNGDTLGKVRLFSADRNTRDVITPHSHRFDFSCIVLEGKVRNTIYQEQTLREPAKGQEMWVKSLITQVCGKDGLLEYVHNREDKPTRFVATTTEYHGGQVYGMTKNQIHSITFAQGTKVLFFEGPEQQKHSTMLEPWVRGRVIPTFKTEDWMFERY